MKRSIIAILALTALVSCDSGDIYPEPVREVGRRIDASFELEGVAAFPVGEYYQMVFGAFADGAEYPLSFKSITKPSGEGIITGISLTNIPSGADYVSLAILDKGKKIVCLLYTSRIEGEGTVPITLPLESIDLRSYHRVQEQVFSTKCIACHGGSNFKAAGLDLTEGNSYDALVGITSRRHAPSLLVDPGSVPGSFLMNVLTERDALTVDHSEIVKDDDVSLVREWILTE